MNRFCSVANLAKKPNAANAMKWGCGALNIDGCRIQGQPPHHNYGRTSGSGAWAGKSEAPFNTPDSGRWPANVMFDEDAAGVLDAQSGIRKSGAHRAGAPGAVGNTNVYGKASGVDSKINIAANEGGASRFFYVTKVTTKERQAGVSQMNDHPTMKPIDLTRQLSTLLLPPVRSDGPSRKLLVPFSGSGSEMIGALLAGWDEVTGIEQSADYAAIARERIAWWIGENLMEEIA